MITVVRRGHRLASLVLVRHGRGEECADPYGLVVELLHKSAANELAIDQADPDLGADDDLDIGW